MKSLITILLLLASACGNPEAFDVESELSADFDRAAEAWCEASGCCPYQGDGAQSRAVASTQATLDRVCGVGELHCDGAAVHHGEATTIHVLDGMTSERTYVVLLHEIGHHCGCGHSDDERDVMFLGTTATELTERDRECAR